VKPWIRTIDPREAVGLLRDLYEAAVRRAGKVFGVIRIMSPRPEQLRDFVAMYRTVMFAPSGVTRAERELVAVVVSQVNHCHY